MYTEAAEEQLLGGEPDYVLDAIDNIDTKVALLAACHRRGIPVLSSAGAGGESVWQRCCYLLPVLFESCLFLAVSTPVNAADPWH